MSPAAQPSLDPVAIASREFGTSRRGFDKDEVREYLRALSTAVRAQSVQPDTSDELATALRDVGRLTAEVAALQARLEDAEARAAAVPAEMHLDEATVSQYIGKETARVLEAARTAAGEIEANAETRASERTEEIDRVQSAANADVAALRKQAHDDVAALRDAAEAEAKQVQTSAAEEAEALLAVAKQEAEDVRGSSTSAAAALREEAAAAAAELEAETEQRVERIKATAEDDASRLLAEAEAERSSVLAAAATLRAEAETDVARVRAEAEADVMASQEAAAETSRLMVVEAQAVREKVLSDLVNRRRLGRQQLDQAKAARDRLHRSLVDVRKQLDEQAAELEISLPEAKAAMDAIARRAQEVDEAQQVRDLAVELDTARIAGIPLSPEEPNVASGSAALDSLDVADATGDDESAGGGVDTIFARLRDDESAGSSEPAGEESEADHEDRKPQSVGAPAGTESPTDGDQSEGVAVEGVAVEGDGELEEDEEDQIDVPDEFVQRDVAMTRFGADLRRRIKRAMADDQSDLLDRLRRAKKMSTADLPDLAEQRGAYVEAVASALQATATAGADMAGGSVAAASVDELVERIVGLIFDPLRQRVEMSVEAAGVDHEEVLEPIRAHYRDMRASEVPLITDDALAEAFALGAYEALSDGTNVTWLADPRMEPNPDCFDNTLAGVVAKPEPFPTGKTHPQGEPGCRCLVVAAT